MSAKIISFRTRLLNFPILTLLHPREQTPLLIAGFLAGIVSGSLVMRWLDWPFWTAVAIVLLALLIPGVFKWRADQRRYGATVMGVSFMLVTQGFHTIEHIAQWVQYHALGWTMRASSGLISPANSEWVHFVWNWTVVLVMTLLVWRGVRNFWAWLALLWSVAHAGEHTYMFIRHLQVLGELSGLGITDITAQGLPGILGRDGWLARNAAVCGVFLSRLPGLTTAVRLDVHFWWNIGEVSLLAMAAHTFLKSALSGRLMPPSNS
ncbi:MAG: hypothetical protein ACT4QE_17495 [Anaerolineales bacterium]